MPGSERAARRRKKAARRAAGAPQAQPSPAAEAAPAKPHWHWKTLAVMTASIAILQLPLGLLWALVGRFPFVLATYYLPVGAIPLLLAAFIATMIANQMIRPRPDLGFLDGMTVGCVATLLGVTLQLLATLVFAHTKPTSVAAAVIFVVTDLAALLLTIVAVPPFSRLIMGPPKPKGAARARRP